MKKGDRIKKTISFVILGVICIGWMFPLVWALLTSFKSEHEIQFMYQLQLLEQEIRVKKQLKVLYYDTAGNPFPDLLPLLCRIAAPDHIMYGSDYPFTPAGACCQSLEGLKGGEVMRITLHIGIFTVTIIVKSRNRHSAK